ncbi:MAG: thioredoxin [Pirellulales bacterium]|nr:thioredoxin [Pirellulales bacterium]
MTNATFYHAGCPVCVTAEQRLVAALDPAKFCVKIVHLGQERAQVANARAAGVRSVPALVVEGTVFHINHGADLTVLG